MKEGFPLEKLQTYLKRCLERFRCHEQWKRSREGEQVITLVREELIRTLCYGSWWQGFRHLEIIFSWLKVILRRPWSQLSSSTEELKGNRFEEKGVRRCCIWVNSRREVKHHPLVRGGTFRHSLSQETTWIARTWVLDYKMQSTNSGTNIERLFVFMRGTCFSTANVSIWWWL